MTAPHASTPPRVLVIRRRHLGDIVLLGALFRNLRLHWPDAHLAALVEAGYAGATPLNPDVNETLVFPRRLSEWPSFVRRLRENGFTHVLDFENTRPTACVTRLSRATHRLTWLRDATRARHRWAYTDTVSVPATFFDTHSLARSYLELLPPLGVPLVSTDVRLLPRERDVVAARALIAPPGAAQRSAKLLIHPGARSRFRIWPTDRFARLADRVQDELGAQIFVVAGPGELALAREISEAAESHLVMLERPQTTPQLAALLAQFDAVLCHEGGPMHLAAAVGTPVVALFSSQNPVVWRPHGDGHRVLQTMLPCTCLPDAERPGPCDRDDSARSYCVRKVTVDEVFTAIADRLRPTARR